MLFPPFMIVSAKSSSSLSLRLRARRVIEHVLTARASSLSLKQPGSILRVLTQGMIVAAAVVVEML